MTNPDVSITDQEVVSERWGTLTLTRFRQRRRDGQSQTRTRESYDRGNGTVVLPYDRARRTVLLSRQFRLPAYLNGHADGMLVEAAAGMVEPGEDPAQTIRREAVEELGVELTKLEHLFRVYMSPGATTEYLDCYAAAYSPAARSAAGGGLAEEGEDIEVLEYHFDDALAAIAAGSIVDAKTIMLIQWAALTGPFAATGDGHADP